MSFPRYPEYKDSGVEWLGAVPAHWNVCALKRIVSMQSGESITAESIDETGEYPVFGGNGLRGYTSGFTHDGKFILVGRQGALCGNVNFASGKFWASEHAVVVTPVKQVNTVWLGEMLRAMNLNQYSVAAAQPGLSVDLVGRVGIVVPPLPEQTQIAAFLDRETAKIDELVAAQRRLMELLKEKRQAVISHAVTKGMNPDAPMKPSGIEWLGDVPAHWELRKLKAFASFFGGGTPNRENLTYWNGDIPWVSPKDMKTERIVGAEESITGEGLLNSSSTLLPAGRALMVVRSGILKHTIPVAINEIAVALNQDMKALKFYSQRCLSYFFLRWVQGLNDQLLLVWAKQGATVESIEQSYLANTVIPLPCLSEQAEIVTFLDVELAKLDTLTTEAQRAIDLLQERRTALISAAVTGQIDVRSIGGTHERIQ